MNLTLVVIYLNIVLFLYTLGTFCCTSIKCHICTMASPGIARSWTMDYSALSLAFEGKHYNIFIAMHASHTGLY